MIIRPLPTYIYLFMKAQNAQPFSLECTKVKLQNNFGIEGLERHAPKYLKCRAKC